MNKNLKLTKIGLVMAVMLIATAFSGSSVIPSAAAFTIDPGNTLVYEVTTFNVPFSQLSTDPNYEGLAAFTGVDLTDSQVYVKILRTNPAQGWYTVAYGAILGRQNTINFTALAGDPSSFDPTAYGLDLSNVVVQAGAGGRITSAESKMWNFFDSTGKGGLFYLDEDQWSDHETQLNARFGSNVTITNGADEFVAKFGNATHFIELTWFKTGDNAGLLKKFNVQWGVTLSDGSTVNISIVITFVARYTRNLANVSTVTMKLGTGNLAYTATGNFSDADTTNPLEWMKGNLSMWTGNDILRYEIGNRDGLFYTTNVYGPANVSNPSDGLTLLGDTVFSAFDGDNYELDTYSGLYYSTSPTLAPMAMGLGADLPAPLMTPDWELTKGEVIIGDSILGTIQTVLTSTQYKQEFLDGVGVTINSIDLNTEYIESTDYVYQSVTISFDVSIDGTKYYANITNGMGTGHGTMNIKYSLKSWIAYSQDGVLGAYATDLSLNLNANNFGFDAQGQGSQGGYSMTTDGTLDLTVAIKLQNKDFASVPSPDEVKASSSVIESAGGGVITPGFELAPMLLLALLPAALLVSHQRRRKDRQ